MWRAVRLTLFLENTLPRTGSSEIDSHSYEALRAVEISNFDQ